MADDTMAALPLVKEPSNCLSCAMDVMTENGKEKLRSGKCILHQGKIEFEVWA